MILAATTIRDYVERGLISIKPHFDPQQLRPFGLRVHLAAEVLVPIPGQRVDLGGGSSRKLEFQTLDIRGGSVALQPGSFVLASTIECLKVSSELMCRLDGRSTLARLGLLVHCTAEVVDSIHSEFRSVVLELANVGPFELVLPHRYAIGMLTFEEASAAADKSHEQNQYEGQVSVAPPNLAFGVPRYGPPEGDDE